MIHSVLTILVLGGACVRAVPAQVGQSTTIPVRLDGVPDFDAALLQAHLRYGSALSDSAALQKRSKLGQVEALNSRGISYLAETSIGTPPQQLNLNFDTGSSDLWVFSSDTPNDQVRGQTKYRPADSRTSVRKNGQWSINYEDRSSASGITYTDNVAVGGLVAIEQVVESATTVSAQFVNDRSSSGLLGLGFDSINTVRPTQAKTWFSTIKNNLANKVFFTNFVPGGTSVYGFGHIDDSLYRGDITYTTVDSARGHWEFEIKGYSYGQVVSNNRIRAVADTGTTLLILPEPIVRDYFSLVANSKAIMNDQNQLVGFNFPCNNALPDFIFNIEATQFAIPGQLINFGIAPGNQNPKNPVCQGGLIPTARNKQPIFGLTALRSAFVVWDVEGSRIGFANRR